MEQTNKGRRVMDDKRGTRHFSERVRGSYVQGRWEIRAIWRQSVFFSVLRPTHYTLWLHDRDRRSTFSPPGNTNRLSPSRFQVLRVGGEGTMAFYDSVNSPTPLAPLLSHSNTRKDHVVYQTRGNFKKITERWSNEMTILKNILISWNLAISSREFVSLESFFLFLETWEEF